jgi:hypothetical protein
VISANREFHEQAQRELAPGYNHLCVTDASSFEGARRAIAARSPAVILLDECALVSGGVAQQGRKPALWAAATSLAECAPLLVVGLETIATLAVRMRETVRRLSEDWETQSEHASEELETHPS